MTRNRGYDEDADLPAGQAGGSLLGALSRPARSASYDAGAADGEEPRGDEQDGYDDLGDEAAAYHGEPEPLAPSGGMLGTVAGTVFVLAGIGLAATWTTGPAVGATLERFGLTPTPFFVIGAVLIGFARLARHLSPHEAEFARVNEMVDVGLIHDEQALAQLGYLVEAESARSDGGAESSQDLQQALHLIKRQEEKISNLSKATKMYGKPLLEITNQIAESSQQMAEVGNSVNAVKIIIEQSSQRLEAALRDQTPVSGGGVALPSGVLDDIARSTREAIHGIDILQREMTQRLLSKSDLQDMQEALARDVAEGSTRVAAGVEQIDGRLEQARAAIITTIDALSGKLDAAGGGGDGSGGDPAGQAALRDGLAALHTAIANVSDTVRDAIQNASLAAPGAAAADATTTSDSSGGGDKGVLSAIAKLKQLRQ
ncbi:MAG: hypothetical protein AAF628_15310 [Planctomycetota bacterium]